MRLKTAVAAIVACFVLAVPGAALAATPTEDAYSGVVPAHNEGGNSHENNTPAPAEENGVEAVSAEVTPVSTAQVESVSGGSTLPFTGLEVGAIALVGLVLIGGGFVLYRFSRTGAPRRS